MLTKEVTYVDFNDDERTEVFYFNLTENEVVSLDVKFPNGGLEAYISQLDPQKKPDEILDLFEMVILKAYGEKTQDGKHFKKSKKLSRRFHQSAAYSALFMELIRDTDQATEFFTSMLSSTTKQPKKKNS